MRSDCSPKIILYFVLPPITNVKTNRTEIRFKEPRIEALVSHGVLKINSPSTLYVFGVYLSRYNDLTGRNV